MVKYLRDRYIERCEEDNSVRDHTADEERRTEREGESSLSTEDNIKLLKRLVDRQTKELAKLNKMMDTLVKR